MFGLDVANAERSAVKGCNFHVLKGIESVRDDSGVQDVLSTIIDSSVGTAILAANYLPPLSRLKALPPLPCLSRQLWRGLEVGQTHEGRIPNIITSQHSSNVLQFHFIFTYSIIHHTMDKINRISKIRQLAETFKSKHPQLVGQSFKIVQVGPRDGLQNQKKIISLPQKQELVNRLSKSGLKVVEVGSFVSPKWVPQMASSKQLFQLINKKQSISYPCLVPNIQGMQTAIQIGVKEVAVFASATEGFSRKNLNCSIKESLQRFMPVMQLAKKNEMKVRGYVSMVMGCAFGGEVHPSQVATVTKSLLDMGCYEVSLGDTVGRGTVEKTRLLFQQLKVFDITQLAVHFHDTFDNAIANILTAMEYGCRIADSSIGGLGGCPYSMKPVGNVCTENLAFALQTAGFKTGLQLAELKSTGDWICQLLQRANLSVL